MKSSLQLKPVLEKRLPAYSGIIVMLFALITTLWLSGNTILFVTKATVGSTPKAMQISNISDTSFTVSYITDVAVTGSIAYGAAANEGAIALDDRDQQGKTPAEYHVHSMTILNLKPATKYYFTIASGAQSVINNGTPYEVTTAPVLAKTSQEKTVAAGTVSLDDGTLPNEGIVTISTPDSVPVTALLDPGGTYSVTFENLRTKNLTEYIPLTPETTLDIQITTPTEQSKATVLASEIGQIPKMILSKNYDFSLVPDSLTSITATESAGTASGSANFPTFENLVAVTSPIIDTPTDNQKFTDPQPLFKGRALPSTEITLVINSQKEITATLSSDDQGSWQFRPPVTIDPGVHTVSISSLDTNGVLQKLTRSFTVYAAGSQFVEPSISPVDVSPTNVPPITPTPPGLPSPTFTPSPFPSPTIALSPSVTPNLTISPTKGPVPPTGNSTFINGIIGAVAAIGIGTLLFIFTAI